MPRTWELDLRWGWMSWLLQITALAVLMWCSAGSAAWAASIEEERLLGCGCEDARLREYLPFTRRYLASGVVRGTLAEAMIEAEIPAAAMVEPLEALAAGLDLSRELRDGDRFYVRYERRFTAEGDTIGVDRVLWAELDTKAKGKVSVHRFQPRQASGDRFWLSTGESTATPRLHMPVETVLISSGFGMRADPFEQMSGGGLPRLHTGHPIGPNAVTKALAAPQTTARVAGNPQARTRSSIYRPTKANARTPSGQKPRMLPRVGGDRSYYRTAMMMHEGVDLVAEQGTVVHAAGDGVVLGAQPMGGYGNWIEIRHDAGTQALELATVYGHLSGFAPGIAPGVRVRQGDAIGFVGSTGRSTGPHLHFEIIENGRRIDPMSSPALRRDQLSGDDLLHFRQQVDRDLRERE
jgi:murein DD-endopeptidase MepM/ murein hydrolase activator NlpD